MEGKTFCFCCREKCLFTWSRTLAVSRGKVTKSAMHAAVPAPINFTAAVGGTSAGLKPTILLELVAGIRILKTNDVKTR